MRVYKTGRAFLGFNELLSCIKDMQRNGGTFRYFVTGLPGLHGPQIDLGHKIIVRSVPSSGELIAYIEILGVLRIGGLFAIGAPGCVLEHMYVYDLLQRADRSSEFSIDPAEFDPQDWRSIGLGPTDVAALKDHFDEVLNSLAEIYYRQTATLLGDPSDGFH
jgi:hypothetical protein